MELSVLESPPPVVPKLLREASDITWQETVESTKDHVILVRRRGRWWLQQQQQFKNSLLAGVGFLELANAGDFAANVWNETPVPKFAAMLMGIGGVFALGMALVAAQDFRLSWRNVKLLRAERTYLQRLRQFHAKNPELVRVLDSRLGVGVREIGTEVVDRVVMDALMGTGSILVGVGTLMAIGGSHPKVYQASNLLSGYIGNALAALFGLVNAIWSAYLIYRFRTYDAAVTVQEPNDDTKRRSHVRFQRFRWHAFFSGSNGLVAGAASIVTATRWWGYVVLVPCIVVLVLCNYFWRKRLGYDRPILSDMPPTNMHFTPLLEDLEYVIAMQRGLSEPDIRVPLTILRIDSLESVLGFISRNRMLETYCESIAGDKNIRPVLLACKDSSTDPNQITISPDLLLRVASSSTRSQILLNHAGRFLQTTGVRIFAHRERHLLELLGYAVWRDQTPPTIDRK